MRRETTIEAAVRASHQDFHSLHGGASGARRARSELRSQGCS